ncbi:hypothetical protein SHELI_v1c10140 [Spiroplasma helicoides]|uniref:Spiralin n=1 Tax=Spiroplasma helicoides TaxID=216938 RepID=A0A1B3SLZ2_9MOLU|nr:lipoprotein [Spiroplasma helicoides]AOG60961.1 hypothetical protein SHELI_v1c10140 [Spiroplasma helicoides]
MKKLLSLLAATGLVATSGSVAVACNKKADDKATTASTDLSTIKGADLTVKPSDNTEAAAKTAVLAQIKLKLKLTTDVKDSTDVVFSAFSAATSAKAGSIVATAADASKVLTPKKTATFALTYVAPAAKKDLSTITTKELGEFSGVGDTPTVGEVVEQVNAKNSGLSLSADDVDMTTPSGKDLKASATLTAKSTSTKFEKAVTVTYTYTKSATTTKKDLSTITGNDLKLEVADNQQATAESAAIAKVKEKLGVDVVKGTDFTVGSSDFTAPQSGTAGKIKLTSKSDSTKLTEGKSVEFTLNLKASQTDATITKVESGSVDLTTSKALSIAKSGNADVKVTVSKVASGTSFTTTIGDTNKEVLSAGNATNEGTVYTVKLTATDVSENKEVKVTFKYGTASFELTVTVTA